jgi:thiosulfate/3-mercaptopyruvate sulfurtransferase
MRSYPGLTTAALILAAVLLFSQSADASRPPWMRRKIEPVYPEILVSASWLAENLGRSDLTVVDGRAAERYGEGHIPDAISLDCRSVEAVATELAGQFTRAGVPSRGMVVCYSDREDAAAAGELFWLLELAGHTDVRVLNGGLDEWRRGGGGIESKAGPVEAAVFDAPPDTSRIAGFDYVMDIFGRQGHTILDWRGQAKWDIGHIPHSLPFPMKSLVTLDGIVLFGPDVRPVFENWGPRRYDFVDLSDEIVVCGDAGPGEVGVHPYLAARLAGIERVRCYREGFDGWRSHPDVPVVRIVEAAEVKSRLGMSWWKQLLKIPPKDLILLDVRSVRDYDVGHIPGAVGASSFTFAEDIEAVITEYWPEVNRATIPIIFYCYGPDCIRSRHCASVAARHGFRNLLWFREGVAGWYQVDGELVSGGL